MRQTRIIDWLLMACVVACILRIHCERKGVDIYGRCGNPSEYPYEEQMMIAGAALGHGIRDGRAQQSTAGEPEHTPTGYRLRRTDGWWI